MTDQSIPEALKGKAIDWRGAVAIAPSGHGIATTRGGDRTTTWLVRDGEIVGRIERRANLWHMYVGPAFGDGWYLGAEGDAAVALARIAKAAERRRAAAGAASAGPAPEPEPDWLIELRNRMWNPISKAFDANGLPHGTENVTNVSAAAAAYAATYLRPLHTELVEAKRALEAVQGSLRARDERIARQDEEIDAFGAEIATNARTLIRQAAEIDALRKWIAKQAAANAWAKATAARPEHLPASATAEAYLGPNSPGPDGDGPRPQWGECDDCAGAHSTADHAAIILDMAMRLPGPALDRLGVLMAGCEASPEMQEVPAGEWRDGDTITGVWCQHAGRDGTGGLPFAESRMGGLTEVMATRAFPPLPKAPGSVGTATVQGRKGVRVMLAPRSDTDRSPWSSAVRVASRFFHVAEEIADYVPELDGQEGN